MDFKLQALAVIHLELLYHAVLSSIICPSYMCKPSFMIFVDKTCVYYDEEAYVYYSKECSGDELCIYDSNLPNKTCTDNDYSFGQSSVGEKCQKKTDCNSAWSTDCANGKCQGFSVGRPCRSNYSCNPGNSCINGICTPQIEIGQKGCITDYDCVNNGACNITSATNPQVNTCYQVFTFEPHEPVGNCLNFRSILCKYLTCAKNIADRNYYCTSLLVSNSEPASLCSINLDKCSSKPDNFFDPPFVANQTCACGYNSEGKSYCKLYLGDAPGISLLSYWAKWYSSQAIFNCNTARRNEFKCITDYWDKNSFNELLYWESYFNLYSYIIGSKQCIIDTVASDYAYAKKLGGKVDSDDNSGIALKIFLLIGLIFI